MQVGVRMTWIKEKRTEWAIERTRIKFWSRCPNIILGLRYTIVRRLWLANFASYSLLFTDVPASPYTFFIFRNGVDYLFRFELVVLGFREGRKFIDLGDYFITSSTWTVCKLWLQIQYMQLRSSNRKTPVRKWGLKDIVNSSQIQLTITKTIRGITKNTGQWYPAWCSKIHTVEKINCFPFLNHGYAEPKGMRLMFMVLT